MHKVAMQLIYLLSLEQMARLGECEGALKHLPDTKGVNTQYTLPALIHIYVQGVECEAVFRQLTQTSSISEVSFQNRKDLEKLGAI